MSIDLAQAEASGDPIGTYESLIEHNLPPQRFGSCSAPSARNKGCSSYGLCRFREYRDRLLDRVGPGNIGVNVITPQHAADGKIMACFQYYKCGLDGIRENSRKNGWLVQIVGLEGAKILEQTTERVHRKKDPNCPDCSSGTCHRMERYEREKEVPKFPRLGETSETESVAYTEKLRKQMHADLEREDQRAAMEANQLPPQTKEVPEHEGPGIIRSRPKAPAER